jgi:hypothetical protein
MSRSLSLFRLRVNGSRSRFPCYVLFPLRGGRVAHLSHALISAASFSKSPNRARLCLFLREPSDGRLCVATRGGSRGQRASEDRRLEVSILVLANRIGRSSITCPACHRTNEHRQAAIFHESEPIAGRLAAPSTCCCCPLRYHAVRLSLQRGHVLRSRP